MDDGKNEFLRADLALLAAVEVIQRVDGLDAIERADAARLASDCILYLRFMTEKSNVQWNRK